jgi:hypothetical protein
MVVGFERATTGYAEIFAIYRSFQDNVVRIDSTQLTAVMTLRMPRLLMANMKASSKICA